MEFILIEDYYGGAGGNKSIRPASGNLPPAAGNVGSAGLPSPKGPLGNLFEAHKQNQLSICAGKKILLSVFSPIFSWVGTREDSKTESRSAHNPLNLSGGHPQKPPTFPSIANLTSGTKSAGNLDSQPPSLGRVVEDWVGTMPVSVTLVGTSRIGKSFLANTLLQTTCPGNYVGNTDGSPTSSSNSMGSFLSAKSKSEGISLLLLLSVASALLGSMVQASFTHSCSSASRGSTSPRQ